MRLFYVFKTQDVEESALLHGDDERAFVVRRGGIAGRVSLDVDAEAPILRVVFQPAPVGGRVKVLQRFRQRTLAAEFRPVGRGERQELHALWNGAAAVFAADHVLERPVLSLVFQTAADGVLADLILENRLFFRRLRLHRLKEARITLCEVVPEFRALLVSFLVPDDDGESDDGEFLMMRDDGLRFHRGASFKMSLLASLFQTFFSQFSYVIVCLRMDSAFPNHKNLPSCLFELTDFISIPLDIPFELFVPILPIG